jgi:hypothetical protein
MFTRRPPNSAMSDSGYTMLEEVVSYRTNNDGSIGPAG